MATLRSDIIIPEIFTPYLVQETTKRDAFLASGVVQPMAELNASEDGGDFIQVPFYKANLSGDFERLTDSSSLCLLYTSPSPRDGLLSRMPSSA